MTATTSRLRLILGDQLSPQHSWFRLCDDTILYVLMECRSETDYVLHHAQKILAIFAAMRDFARQLQAAGHRVHYLAIDDVANRHSFTGNLDLLLAQYAASHIDYQAPDEYRLDQQLAAYRPHGVSVSMVGSEHFYTERDSGTQLFAGRKKWLQENMYRSLRKQYRVLLDDEQQPLGGQWNFDADNRGSWKGVPAEPVDRRPRHDHSQLWQTITAAGVASFGAPNAEQFGWVLNRVEALQQLDAFITHGLPYFGQFQDAMSVQAWRLFHSLLSFALNTKMLAPYEVVQRVEAATRAGHAPLAAAEGYIRQILGWREYIRCVYWARMPGYEEENYFQHQRPLPSWFWSGATKMRCVASVLQQSLQQAHAHHIQRLMVIGNFALLAGFDPAALHRWYLGIYIDAFEWVELPNTLGMSQFADGGMLATKPYVSAAAYIDKMSDYCKGCHYDKKQRIGERACPYNALYWDFFSRNEDKLASNPRIGMVYPQLRKMDPDMRQQITAQAEYWRVNLEQL